MRNYLPTLLMLALPLFSQLSGVINSTSPTGIGEMSVQLIDVITRRVLADVRVFGDGTFDLPPHAPGFAELRVVKPAGTTLYVREIHTAAPGAIAIHLPSPLSIGSPGPVSVARLSHRPPKVAVKEFKAAQKANQNKDTVGTLEHLKATVALDPDYFDAIANLEAFYLKSPTLETAKPYLDRAREIDPNDGPNATNLPAYHAQRGEYLKAEEFARMSLKSDPSSAKAHYMLAFALINQVKDLKSVREHLTEIGDRFAAARSLLQSIVN